MQSKWGSFIESWVNVLIGWGVAMLSQILIFPLFSIHLPVSTNFKISAWFTVISVVRSYVVRRLFNHHHQRTRTNNASSVSATPNGV